MPLSLADLPIEVYLDGLFPLLTVSDLHHLAATSRFFTTLADDSVLWKRRLLDDYGFSGAGTARTSGWKLIYKGLRDPKVFVWGHKSHGRLGLPEADAGTSDVSYPLELPFPSVRIVNLVAGGWSFHALDSKGNIWVWGTLDGESMAFWQDGFSESSKQARLPHRLDMPNPTRSISCGRFHSSSLDERGQCWMFLSWGRPFRLGSQLLDCSGPDSTPLQIECGWTFTAILTKAGDVFVVWPFMDPMLRAINEVNNEMDEARDKTAQATPELVIPCVTWVLTLDPARLRPLPELPRLPGTGESEASSEPVRLIQIAGLDNCLVGLTNRGHVLKFGHLGAEATMQQGYWEYLPMFSELDRVKEHPTFVLEGDYIPPESPDQMKITHVTAHFQRFVAYSTGASSIVLMGDVGTTPTSEPSIIPSLQNKGVISVVIGDYHYGALTSTGKLLTWGAYSRGALGLGDPDQIEVGQPGGYADERTRQASAWAYRRSTPPPVTVPTEVAFDHGLARSKDRFCFAVTAAGWHMGALVIDLEPDVESEAEADPLEEPHGGSSGSMSGQSTAPPQATPFTPSGPGELPIFPAGRGTPAFRIGFAGRGMRRSG